MSVLHGYVGGAGRYEERFSKGVELTEKEGEEHVSIMTLQAVSLTTLFPIWRCLWADRLVWIAWLQTIKVAEMKFSRTLRKVSQGTRGWM